MKIAVLNFGSFVKQSHDDRTLEVESINQQQDPFKYADLKLPVRLGGIYSPNTEQKCIINVLDERASAEPIFYAKSTIENLDTAIGNLRKYQGIEAKDKEYIGYVNLKVKDPANQQNFKSRSRIPNIAEKVAEWARKNNFDAVIWTDLPPENIFGENSRGREIMGLLKNDPVLLRNTAKFLQTLPSLNKLQKDVLHLNYVNSLTADFSERDKMPQTDVPKDEWFHRRFAPRDKAKGINWGPPAKLFDKPEVLLGADPVKWKRDRIVEAAIHMTGLKYKTPRQGGREEMRGHFPARGCGLDCSNFVAWVYNYALGISLTSDVDELETAENVRKLRPEEKLEKGDLILIGGNVKHVVIYIDEDHVIDSTSLKRDGVQIRNVNDPDNQRYKHNKNENPRFMCALRVIE